MRLVTPQQMRRLEELSDQNGVSYAQLMEHAGQQLSVFLLRQIRQKKGGKILFLCGNGNNGGDCFVAARLLSSQGVPVSVGLLCGIPKTILAYSMYKQLGDIPVLSSIAQIKEAIGIADFVVDGVFGTGFHGTLHPEQAELFALASSRFCIGVDIPSGGNAETGAVVPGTMRCRMTVSFGACKFGMVQYPLKTYCGEILVADIGIPESAYQQIDYPMAGITERMIANFLPSRQPDSHKGQFGKLLCITGSERMPGAAVMSAAAALRCGVGLMRLAAPRSVIAAMCARYPEPMYLPMQTDEKGFALSANGDMLLEEMAKSTAVLIGCGLGETEETKALVTRILQEATCPVILDADGINCVTGCIDIIKEVKVPLILTPHPAEMARLLHCTVAAVQSDRMEQAGSFAREHGVTLVLKGAGTIVATPEGAFVNSTGNSGMSKGGSGDVLAGMLASLVAQGIPPTNAACMAVFLHGKAGDCAAEHLSEQAMLPTDLIGELPGLFLKLEQRRHSD